MSMTGSISSPAKSESHNTSLQVHCWKLGGSSIPVQNLCIEQMLSMLLNIQQRKEHQMSGIWCIVVLVQTQKTFWIWEEEQSVAMIYLIQTIFIKAFLFKFETLFHNEWNFENSSLPRISSQYNLDCQDLWGFYPCESPFFMMS